MSNVTSIHSKQAIRVGVIGAAGRMGRCLLKTLLETSGYELVMAIGGTSGIGEDVSTLLGTSKSTGIVIEADLTKALARTQPDVVVELIIPSSVYANTQAVLSVGLPCVVGATGITDVQQKGLAALAESKGVGLLLAPNFSLGAVLMMKMAREAAQYFTHAEIIERHHEKKIDAPSGTALRTAAMMAESRDAFGQDVSRDAHETLPGARGAKGPAHIPIHSVRLPGSLAHQQVQFGSMGETLTIQHDTQDRTAFMGGILLAVREIRFRQGLFVGLETMMP